MAEIKKVLTTDVFNKYITEQIKPYVDAINIENGTGSGSVQMKSDGGITTFDFTEKNPNATFLDPTLTGNIPYGATGQFATSFGGKNAAQGKRASSQGTSTIAKGDYAHSEGSNSVSLGTSAHSEGIRTTANQDAAHSEGFNTVANAIGAHSEGFNTTANGNYSHAGGEYTLASGTDAFAHGSYNTASGFAATAFGGGNVAAYTAQTVVGYFNANKTNTVFEVGNGTYDEETHVSTRKNAFEVYKDGHAEVEAMGNTNLSVATKQYVDSRPIPQRTVIMENFYSHETDNDGAVTLDLPSGLTLNNGDILFIQAYSDSWGSQVSNVFRYNENRDYYDMTEDLDVNGNTLKFNINFYDSKITITLYDSEHTVIVGETIHEVILYKLPF